MINIYNDYLNGNQSTLYPQLSDWTDYTPTIQGYSSVSNLSFRYRRVGSNVEIEGYFTGGTVQSSEFRITLPSGMAIDSIGTRQHAGLMITSISSSQYKTFTLNSVVGQSYVTYAPVGDATGSADPLGSPNLANSYLTSSMNASVKLSVPIQGWTALGTTNLSELPDARTLCKAWGNVITDTTIASGYNFAAVAKDSIGNYTITFTNPMADSNYSVSLGQRRSQSAFSIGYIGSHSYTTTGFKIVTGDTNGNPADFYSFNFQVFGN